MEARRSHYLQKLKDLRWNGRVKIITGIRRSGKSYLLNTLFYNSLIKEGINKNQIIVVQMDDDANIEYRNPILLGKWLREQVKDSDTQYYILIDEIQKVGTVANPYLPNSDDKITFVDVLLGMMKLKNVDIYVTGSNSKMLSKDIRTEFRDRGDEIHVNPLTYSEFVEVYTGDLRNAWRDYMTYGGMPYLLHLSTHDAKVEYLKNLFQLTYLRDVVERNKILADISVLESLLNYLASAVGSLCNPKRLADTFNTEQNMKLSSETIARYLRYFSDAYLIREAMRYDVKGRRYLSTPMKYYYADVGLRNARLNFRQQEENHIMENILYNELISRQFSVDVGVVTYHWKDENKRSQQSNLEVDFVVNKLNQRYYIQSALHIDTEEKRLQEINSLRRIEDSFKKIVVVKDNVIPWYDEDGIYFVGIEDFLLKTIDTL